MLAPLLAIPSLINTLLSRLTEQRLAALEDLSALENLDVAVSSRAAGIVRSVQRQQYRGTPGLQVDISITPVTSSKSICLSVGKAASGTVATNSQFNLSLSPNRYIETGNTAPYMTGTQTISTTDLFPTYSQSGVTLSGGSTNLYANQYSAYLYNDSTVRVDGPCDWQVIEFY